MKYRSKPTECEAEQWDGGATMAGYGAQHIVEWVNANGGEALYLPSRDDCNAVDAQQAHIKVRTINGWAYAAPGHYVVMGSATFSVPPQWPKPDVLRDFYPCDPETFEKRWEPVQ